MFVILHRKINRVTRKLVLMSMPGMFSWQRDNKYGRLITTFMRGQLSKMLHKSEGESSVACGLRGLPIFSS